MAKEKIINIDILPSQMQTGSVDGIPVSDAQTIDDDNDALVTNIAFKRPTYITTPNAVLVDQNYTNRGEYQEKKNLKITSLRKKYKDDELAQCLERPRYGLELTPDEKIFFYECLFGWNNGQSINATDPDNKYFLVNSITGRYGDVVIGTYDDNDEPRIMWKEMAEDFINTKNGNTKPTKKAITKSDDGTHNFKDMVTRLIKDVRKRIIVSYIEQNEFGESVTTENIVQPLTLGTVTKNGVKYIVLRFADFMIYQTGRATTKYRTAPPALMKAIQSSERERTKTAAKKANKPAKHGGDKARAATLNLLCQIRVILSANLKNLKVDKERTNIYNGKGKSKRKAHIIERKFKLKTLIKDTSAANLIHEHHKAAREDFGTAVKNLIEGGIIYDIQGDENFESWFVNDAGKPQKFKTWAEFYDKTNVILYLIKDV